MVKVCAVRDCERGGCVHRDQCRKSGLRQPSLFRVPQCPNLRQRWMTALSQNLAMNQFVCDVHFRDADVKRFHKVVYPDGNEQLIQRTKLQLCNDAVPILQQQQEAQAEEEEEEEQQQQQLQQQPMDCDVGNFDDMHVDESGRNADEAAHHDGPFTMEMIKNHLESVPLLESWCWIKSDEGIKFAHLNRRTLAVRFHLEVANDLSLAVRVPEMVQVPLDKKFTSGADITTYLRKIECLRICSGTGINDNRHAAACTGFIPVEQRYERKMSNPRCKWCRGLRQRLQSQIQQRKSQIKHSRAQQQLNLCRRKCKRLVHKTNKLQIDVANARCECAAVSETVLAAKIAVLPEAQQEAVRTCFAAAKTARSNGRRYTTEWIYECLLMRIKNSKLYDHLRVRNILPLPCKDTLMHYIQKVSSSAYGFQQAIFECLRIKGSRMEPADKRGTLLVDEMKLSEGISFNTRTMEFNGFVDLGQYTPTDKRNVRGDHALVFMFQPFRGAWVQVLGCFLTKNSVTSDILGKLLVDSIVLLGNAGFHVDVVTSDGAQWNRGVWTNFGIDEDNLYCAHPCNPNKKLFMTSDFPHLIKCFRNCIVKHLEYWTPDGNVKKAHWEALLAVENHTDSSLRCAHKLSPAHINPVGYQKMNVPLAFELFSHQVQTAMALYNEKCPALHDSLPTQKFMKRVDDLIQAMMSRTPLDALRPNDCLRRTAIIGFLEYLEDWETKASAQKIVMPISSSTLRGLNVTLSATLEILEVLRAECNYEYLMTSRLNQDALERFFGMMRGACGSNDHPDPKLFIQVFRLLCCYSLVRPPKGSNVSGTELLEPLMKTKESIIAAKSSKAEWCERIDRLLDGDNGNQTNDIDSREQDHDYEGSAGHSSLVGEDRLHDHDYDVNHTSEEVQAYVAGYVVRKMMNTLKCFSCRDSLQSRNHEPTRRDEMIRLMDLYGGLIYPSDHLYNLTAILESTILDVVGKSQAQLNSLLTVLDRVPVELPMVGCAEHQKETTKHVINFYVVTRGHFLCRSFNRNNDENQQKTKRSRKTAKLY